MFLGEDSDTEREETHEIVKGGYFKPDGEQPEDRADRKL
jgi:hypothetical protein